MKHIEQYGFSKAYLVIAVRAHQPDRNVSTSMRQMAS